MPLQTYGELCYFHYDDHYTHTDDGPFIVTFYIEDGDLNVDRNLGESITSSYKEFNERFGFERQKYTF